MSSRRGARAGGGQGTCVVFGGEEFSHVLAGVGELYHVWWSDSIHNHPSEVNQGVANRSSEETSYTWEDVPSHVARESSSECRRIRQSGRLPTEPVARARVGCEHSTARSVQGFAVWNSSGGAGWGGIL